MRATCKAVGLNNTRLALAATAVVAISGCGGNSASPIGATTVVQPATSKVQLAVGTANIFGLATGLNVTSTLRTTEGTSVLLNTPKLTGPFRLPGAAGTPDANGATIVDGPSASEIRSGGIISATNQVLPGTLASAIPATTFGIRGGVFAGGFQPANADNIGNFRNVPYTVPAYDPLSDTDAGDPNAFTPWGGPPAFDPNKDGQGARDGTFDASVPGFNEFITVFQGVTVAAGTYTLAVTIPTNSTSTTASLSASTTLGAVRTLGTVTAPTFVPNGSGGGTFAVVLPAGVTDGLLNIEDFGPAPLADGTTFASCYLNGAPPAYFTIHVTGSGTYTLPNTDGVGSPTQKTPTICTAAQNAAVASNAGTAPGPDVIAVQLIGADYPIYSSNYLFNLGVQTPNIKGAGGNDITISAVSTQGGTAAAAAVLRRNLKLKLRHI